MSKAEKKALALFEATQTGRVNFKTLSLLVKKIQEMPRSDFKKFFAALGIHKGEF